MKIISKYKDFYDYFAQDYDADLKYVRNINVVKELYYDLLKKGLDYKFCLSYNTHYVSKYMGYSPLIYNNIPGEIHISNYVFGIYPYIYSSPVLYFTIKTVAYNDELIKYLLTYEDVESIRNSKDPNNVVLAIANKAMKSYINKQPNPQIFKKITLSIPKSYKYFDIVKVLNKYVWKNENKELFFKLNAPIFTLYYSDLFYDGPYYDDLRNIENIKYITNFSFQKLNMNISKYWMNELNDLNTYINIENFLWASKQEPISNPDNNTKIVSHGFDLKTSFRKM